MAMQCPICEREFTGWDAEYIKENGTCEDCDK